MKSRAAVDQSVAVASDAAHVRWAVSQQPNCALLESSPGFGSLGRICIYAAQPRAHFQVRGRRWRLSCDWPGAKPPPDASPFAALRFLLRQTRGEGGTAAPFAGGWIGFLGYDLAVLLERLPRRLPADGELPDLHLAYYDAFAWREAEGGAVHFEVVDRFGEGESSRQKRRDRFRRCLELGRPLTAAGRSAMLGGELRSDFTPDEYKAAVVRILEYLRAGDVFQVNLSQRFSAPWIGDVPELFHRAMDRSPAPFGSLIRGGDWSIVSTSPERFVRLEPDGSVETRPIKGTRPRGRDADEDQRLRAELVGSEKDHAELAMIVDLERNDLGRVCDFGAIQVVRHAAVESYSNVHHLVSTVVGRLHPRFEAVDLIKAMFPGGSITGAPKIRAMQIIDELERRRRGVYTGAIGYFSDDGRVDFNIAIRTMVVAGGRIQFHVGGGVVVDSVPDAEYRETLAKGSRLREILQGDDA